MKRWIGLILFLSLVSVSFAAVPAVEQVITGVMPKNTVGKIMVYAYDEDDGTAKTGDAAQITIDYFLDAAAKADLADTSAAEIDSTNAPGWYVFDLAAAETNGAQCLFVAKSSTATIRVTDYLITFATPVTATSGVVEANVAQISGDSTAADNAEDFWEETATAVANIINMFDGDGYAGGTTVFQADVTKIHGSALTETAGQLAAAFTKFFDVATPTGTVDSIPDAVAGTAGGLFIAGTNAQTTVTSGFGADTINATTIATGSIDADAIADNAIDAGAIATGAVDADAVADSAIDAGAIAADAITNSELGATAVDEIWGAHHDHDSAAAAWGADTFGLLFNTAIPFVAPGSSGGLWLLGTNTGDVTFTAASAATPAIKLTGNTTGAGLQIVGGVGNSNGLTITADGTGHGISVTGGDGATGNGINVVAASTDGHGVSVTGIGAGEGISVTGGATGNGIEANAGATSGHGFYAASATSGNGMYLSGAGATGRGFYALGSQYGLYADGGIYSVGTTNYPGIYAVGTGTGSGIKAQGGATGPGLSAAGGGNNANASGIVATRGGALADDLYLTNADSNIGASIAVDATFLATLYQYLLLTSSAI